MRQIPQERPPQRSMCRAEMGYHEPRLQDGALGKEG